MLIRRVSDLTFGKLTRIYGRSVSYEWEVEGNVYSYPSTKQLSNQHKLREFILETTGEAVLRVPAESWAMILNRAFATIDTPSEKELTESWLKGIAEYCALYRSNDQRDIAKGKVYLTATGFAFTAVGMVKYLNDCKDMKYVSNEWHQDKLIKLLDARTTSLTLKHFRGRAVKINSFSCRVDNRFIEYYDEYKKQLATVQTDNIRPSWDGKDDVHLVMSGGELQDI